MVEGTAGFQASGGRAAEPAPSLFCFFFFCSSPPPPPAPAGRSCRTASASRRPQSSSPVGKRETGGVRVRRWAGGGVGRRARPRARAARLARGAVGLPVPTARRQPLRHQSEQTRPPLPAARIPRVLYGAVASPCRRGRSGPGCSRWAAARRRGRTCGGEESREGRRARPVSEGGGSGVGPGTGARARRVLAPSRAPLPAAHMEATFSGSPVCSAAFHRSNCGGRARGRDARKSGLGGDPAAGGCCGLPRG